MQPEVYNTPSVWKDTASHIFQGRLEQQYILYQLFENLHTFKYMP